MPSTFGADKVKLTSTSQLLALDTSELQEFRCIKGSVVMY